MLTLITTYFNHPYKRRREEILRCLHENALNPLIDRIILLAEEPFTPFGKIEVVNIGARATFQNAFYQTPITDDDIVIVSNSDITFEGLEHLKEVDWNNMVLALSRHDIQDDGSLKLWNHQDSQDAWIFKGKIKPMFCNFFFGSPGCDNRLAWELDKAGYNVYNPANTIILKHRHNTKIISYGIKETIPKPYAFVPVGAWHEVPKVKLKKVLHIGIEKFVIDSAIGRELKRYTHYHFISWQDYCTNYQFTDSETKQKFEDECIKWSQWADEVFIQVQTPNIISAELADKTSGIKIEKEEIPNNIIDYSKEELIKWLRYKAGCSNMDYFGAKKGVCGLDLQQVPEEYAQLLCWFREQNFESYLELGVGRGGSFLLNCLFQFNIQRAIAVDNSSYWQEEQRNNIHDKIIQLHENGINCLFYDMNSGDYFNKLTDEIFDCIFIDADHSYEGVKKDYDNALKHIKDGGYLIFHDIVSTSCEGVRRLWNEIKEKGSIEFVYGNNCGIGIIKVSHNKNKLKEEAIQKAISRGVPLILESDIRNTKYNKNALVIIETRPNVGLKETISNHIKYLPKDWDIIIYHSKLNAKEIKGKRIKKRLLNTDTLDTMAYNTLLTSINFWEELQGYNRVLISQTDSRMLRTGVGEFMGWDICGAPHTFCTWTCNGGFSLRNPKVMLMCCQQYAWTPQNGNEDIWFGNILHDKGIGNPAPRTVNERFACEAIYKLGTLAYHAIGKHLSPEQVKQIKEQYGMV